MRKLIVAMCIMLALLMPAWAETYNQSQLGLLAKECIGMGKVIGFLESVKTVAVDSNSELARATYNSMVPDTNNMINAHNSLMLHVFADNATLLSKLLIEPFTYL